MDEPDTYSGAKHVSRVNKVAQPHPSGGDLYGLPRAVDPMLLRALQQRQSQSPQRFFKDGTHGQDFEQRALHEYGHKQHAAAQPNRWSDEDRKRYRADLVAAGHVEGENETRFWDEVDEDIDARTRARQKAERQGETVSGTETPKFDLDALDD